MCFRNARWKGFECFQQEVITEKWKLYTIYMCWGTWPATLWLGGRVGVLGPIAVQKRKKHHMVSYKYAQLGSLKIDWKRTGQCLLKISLWFLLEENKHYLALPSHWMGWGRGVGREEQESWLLSDGNIVTTAHKRGEWNIQRCIQIAACGHIQARRTMNVAQYKNGKKWLKTLWDCVCICPPATPLLGLRPGRGICGELSPVFPGSKREVYCSEQISLNK